MYKLEIYKDGNTINSLDDWLKLAPPKKESIHWKDSRSAKELARYIIGNNGHLPKKLEEVLIDIGIDKSGKLIGIPESVTSLVGKGEGRNHDLLIVKENEVVIGIEAKVDEPLGKLISKEVSNEKISQNKLNRIDTLCKAGYEDIDFYVRYIEEEI